MSFIGTPSTATSQASIDVKHGEMTLLGCKKRVKFNLYQSIQLTDEEKMKLKRIESSLLHLRSKHPESFKRIILKDLN